MPGLPILEVVIGVVFIFMLVSLICSAIREGIEAWLKTRARYLEHGIRQLLRDEKGDGLAAALYNHPLVSGLFSGAYTPSQTSARPGLLASGSNLPSYIPGKNFALALLDLAARGPQTSMVASDPQAPVVTLAAVRANIATLGNPAVERGLLAAIDSAQNDINKALANVEEWYDSGMDRVSGWYKRSTHWILFWIALVVAVGLNINTITVAEYLYRDHVVRAAIVARAAKAAAGAQPAYAEAKRELETLILPIGWAPGWGAPRGENETKWSHVWRVVVAPVLGWLLTALAATLGAPFWFDVLNKFMVIRSTVKPHEKSPPEASEDRQIRSGAPADAGKTPTPPPAVGSTGPVSRPAPTGAEPRQWRHVPSPPDTDTSRDGCHGGDITGATADEDLPAARGGVA